jgi:V/A-type H+/Na+-transporting ATPase subunit F
MKILVIGHPDAVLGFSLAGVNGRAVTTAEQADKALNEALASKENGIILVTQDVAQMLQERVEHLKLHSTIPLVVEIPSPAGVPADQPSLSEVVLKAIGIRL